MQFKETYNIVHEKKTPRCEILNQSIDKETKPSKCNSCDGSFSLKHSLKTFLICDASFSRRGNLNRHSAAVHEKK